MGKEEREIRVSAAQFFGISASSSRGLGASNFQFRGSTMSGEGQCYPGEFES